MMKRLWLLLMLLYVSPAWAMEHYVNVVRNQQGDAVSNVTVYVYLAGTTTLATIYSDNGVTQKNNPFTTSNNVSNGTYGSFDFYSSNGVFDLVFSKPGITFSSALTRRISLFDVNDGGGGGGGGSSAFQDITSGTNLSAAMIVGSGASLDTTGSGIIDANRFNGNTLIGLADGGTNASSWTASRCVRVNSGGTALESASSDCAAPAFSSITTGTNSTASMIVGTGAAIAPSGTGQIIATGVLPNTVSLGGDTTGNYVASATASQGLTLTGTEGGSLGLQTCTNGQILKNVGGTSWACSADSTGGTPTFDSIGSGTNSTATMTVGTGSTLMTSGSGTIIATTSAALTTNGANCTAGQGAGGVSAAGAAENCTDYMEEPGSSGIVARTGANVSAARTITGTASEISVSNGDGVAANPVLSLPSSLSLTGKSVTVGSGGSIVASGTGTITATAVVADAVALGTGTTGNYVSGITANQGLLLTGTEGATVGLIACTNGQILKNSGGTTWGCAADSSGGAFDTLTSGTNTTATMTVSTGASLTFSGSGTVNASTYKGNTTIAVADGGTNLTTATDDNVMVGNGTTWQTKALPSCSNASTSKLLYDNSTNAFSCGTDQGSGAGTTFDAIATGTNTTATMVVSTGAGLTPSGTGVIAANSIWSNVTTVNAGNSPYPAVNPNSHIFCDATAGSRTINLPAATNRNMFFIYVIGSNGCQINRAGADTIFTGISSGLTSYTIRNAGSNFWFKSDGTNTWYLGG